MMDKSKAKKGIVTLFSNFLKTYRNGLIYGLLVGVAFIPLTLLLGWVVRGQSKALLSIVTLPFYPAALIGSSFCRVGNVCNVGLPVLVLTPLIYAVIGLVIQILVQALKRKI